MSLQWTAIAGILYAEIAFTILMLLPFVSPTTWHSFFNSRLILLIKRYKYVQHIFVGGMGFLLVDALRDVSRYTKSSSDLVDVTATQAPAAEAQFHMRLFRAQRNFYIAGFTLFLFYIIKSLAAKLSYEAQLLISNSAVIKQAENASKMARQILSGQKGKTIPDSEALEKAKILQLEEDIRSAASALKAKDKQINAIKTQSEGLTVEYDHLLEEHEKLHKAHALIVGKALSE
ncbi:B-cell receptor-associated protein 31-like isoform X3 [Paramacrobiotus metropolitanus]|nr:B-cell receptor-associated protein 31-like isoform X3 [Paramacrobiotus metropolitanus]